MTSMFAIRAGAALLTVLLAGASAAQDAGCKLKYPIVLSHHWSMSKLCSDSAPATGPASCMRTLDYASQCAVKTLDAQGQPACERWQVPADDEDLPPRNRNVVEPDLTRDVRQYHRYFSRAIVQRLRETCGNAVYLADKPAFASYEVRARSLRNTVQQALAAEHADKVILIGVSQGVQDARYMAALLPMDDADASKGRMKDKVAAIVSLAGEDAGSESSSIALDLAYVLNGGQWADASKIGFKDSDVQDAYWQRATPGGTALVLGERCQGQAECDTTPADRFRWSMRSLFDLSVRHMKPPLVQAGLSSPANWDKLRQFVQAPTASWAEEIPPALEAGNGIRYLSYAGRIVNWNPAWGDVFSRDFLLFSAIGLSDGANDVHVSVKRQRFANTAPNFENVKTLQGPLWSRGYHHLFYTGRNDKLYVPTPDAREAAPYNGDSADFYRQVARDLKARGL